MYFFKLTQPLTYLYSSVTVHCKGERRKANRKPYPLPYGLRNPYRNLKSKNSHDYAQKPQVNDMFMNSASVLRTVREDTTTTFSHDQQNFQTKCSQSLPKSARKWSSLSKTSVLKIHFFRINVFEDQECLVILLWLLKMFCFFRKPTFLQSCGIF